MGETKFAPEKSLGFMLGDVSRLLRRNFNRRVQVLGLTQAQWKALFHISRNEGMRQAQLADILEVQPISVARLIDRMETAGWVRRQPDAEDRRAVNLYLTEKVEPLLAEMRKCSAELQAVAFAGIDEAAQAALMAQLTMIRKNLCDEG